jgi:hypothetical protein
VSVTENYSGGSIESYRRPDARSSLPFFLLSLKTEAFTDGSSATCQGAVCHAGRTSAFGGVRGGNLGKARTKRPAPRVDGWSEMSIVGDAGYVAVRDGSEPLVAT